MTLPLLKEPWHSIEDERSDKLAIELEREVSSQHAMHGKKVRAVAVRQDCDDVLFEIQGGPAAFAVVHLTWLMKEDPNPKFPWTEFYSSLEEWQTLRMIPDHEDFTCT